MTAGATEARLDHRARRSDGPEGGRMVRRLAGIVATCAVVVSCAARTRHAPDSADLKRALVGRWTLKSADGHPAAELDRGPVVLDIRANGKWIAEVTRNASKYGRITIDFDRGKWRLSGDSVQLSHPLFGGTAKVRVDGDQLTLDPDFVVRIDDKRVPCTYQREGPPQTGAHSESR